MDFETAWLKIRNMPADKVSAKIIYDAGYDEGRGKCTGIKIFHGGCHGCNQQLYNDIEFCDGCMYRRANWDLPSLHRK